MEESAPYWQEQSKMPPPGKVIEPGVSPSRLVKRKNLIDCQNNFMVQNCLVQKEPVVAASVPFSHSVS